MTIFSIHKGCKGNERHCDYRSELLRLARDHCGNGCGLLRNETALWLASPLDAWALECGLYSQQSTRIFRQPETLQLSSLKVDLRSDS